MYLLCEEEHRQFAASENILEGTLSLQEEQETTTFPRS
jgi:hypothetical protein